jgi:hypothetical protein
MRARKKRQGCEPVHIARRFAALLMIGRDKVSVHSSPPRWAPYRVASPSTITVRITLEDGQEGGWEIAIRDKTWRGRDPAQVSIGKGNDLVGQVLQVVTTVVDVRPEASRLSATVTISGGPDGDVRVAQSYDDGAAGDTAILTTLVGFQSGHLGDR